MISDWKRLEDVRAVEGISRRILAGIGSPRNPSSEAQADSAAGYWGEDRQTISIFQRGFGLDVNSVHKDQFGLLRPYAQLFQDFPNRDPVRDLHRAAVSAGMFW